MFLRGRERETKKECRHNLHDVHSEFVCCSVNTINMPHSAVLNGEEFYLFIYFLTFIYSGRVSLRVNSLFQDGLITLTQ